MCATIHIVIAAIHYCLLLLIVSRLHCLGCCHMFFSMPHGTTLLLLAELHI